MQPARTAPAGATLPCHIAIIMDGNRRWARSRGMPPIYGHQRGADAVRRTVEGCREMGVGFLTVYAFSSENWKRPAGEVGGLMDLLRYYLRQEIEALDRNAVRLRFIGSRQSLPPDIDDLLAEAEIRTRGNAGLTLTIALNYGARQEIVNAARRLAVAAASGVLAPEAIDEAAFAHALDTADVPDPDLLIRTSGEQRLSNFLLWQLAYTELVFLPISWPDFGKEHLQAAIDEYRRRERRYGASGG
jgi:undecaprenyl diphosphate synthase